MLRERRVGVWLLTFLVICATTAALGAQGEGLAAALRKYDAARDDVGARSEAVALICAIANESARRAALQRSRTERTTRLRVSLLQHAAKLDGLEKPMLETLESSSPMPVRAVAAGWFVAKRGDAGFTLCSQLQAERKRDAELAQAVLVAFARQPTGSRAAIAFVKRFDRAPPSLQVPVLRALRDCNRRHVDVLRRSLLEKGYVRLRGEALAQLVQRGDPKARAQARKLASKKSDPALAPLLFDALAARPETSDLPLLGSLIESRSARTERRLVAFANRVAKNEAFATWARAFAVSGKRAGVRRLAITLIARSEDGGAAERLLEVIDKDTDVGNRRAAIAALVARKDRRVIPKLEPRLLGGPIESRLDALEGLEKLHPKDAKFDARLVELAAEGPRDLRAFALELGAKRGVAAMLPFLDKLLKASDWRLRVAGAQLAKRVRARSSVPLLVKALQRAKGRAAAEIKDSLAGLTRLYFERPQDWKAWWAREEASFKLPPPKEANAQAGKVGARDGGKAAAGGAKPAANAGGGTLSRFYGIPVVSDRVVFCLDVSGSMRELSGTGLTRLKIAQQALTRVLRKQLGSGSQVGLVFFDDRVRSYQKRLSAIKTTKQLDAAIAFVKKQSPLGGTNVYGALIKALSMRNVDTVYLLSDGEPSSGEVIDAQEIGEEMLLENRRKRVVFHCVSIGRESPLLARLARESGGNYVVER